MILGLLLGTALAQSVDAQTQRLLGPAPSEPVATTPTPSPTGSFGLGWPLAGLVVAGGIVYAARQRALSPHKPDSELRVVGRAALTKDSAVSLLEVRDADGRWRRLLIGSGSTGPELLTGLGASAGSPADTTGDPTAGWAVDDLPEVPAYPVPAPPPPPASRPQAAAPAVRTSPPPVRATPSPERPARPGLARGAPPARSYAEVAAALHADEPAPPPAQRPQSSQAAEPVEAPVTSARAVLAMIERERRRRVGADPDTL